MNKDFNLNESIRGIWDKLADWLDSLILNLPNFILAAIVFFIFVLFSKYVAKFVDKLLRRKGTQHSIRQITAKVIKAVIILAGFFFALGLLNLDTVLTSVLAGAGVVALAVGLALQGTLNNTFSGVILSFYPELHIGDWIETNGFSGEVMEITLRNVLIKGTDNNFVVIPNSKIIEQPFKNFTRTSRSRVILKCRVSYSSDLEMVESLTKEVIGKIFPQQGNEEVEFMYQEFDHSSINYVLRFWTDVSKNRDILIAKNKAIIAIKKAYDEKGIYIPFPIRSIISTTKEENY